MTGPGMLSLSYALCQMTAGYFFAHRLKAGLIFGTLGGMQGLALAIWSPDARGLVISCSAYMIFNVQGLMAGRWNGVPWFRHPKKGSK